MIAITPFEWSLLAAAAAHAAECWLAARWARRTGRSALRWLLITAACTALPAVATHCLRRRSKQPADATQDQQARGDWRRCPHCGAVIESELPDSPSGAAACPACGMYLEQRKLA